MITHASGGPRQLGGIMSYCRICKKSAQGIFDSANDNAQSSQVIRVPSDSLIAQPSSVRRLAMAYRSMNLPRRKVIDFVAGHLFFYEGPILHRGVHVCFDGDLDEAFGMEKDPSGRWLGDFLNFALEPPRQQAQRRVVERLTLLWTALAIHSRAQAEHVIR